MWLCCCSWYYGFQYKVMKQKMNCVHRAERDKLTHRAIESPKVPDPGNEWMYFQMSTKSIDWRKSINLLVNCLYANPFLICQISSKMKYVSTRHPSVYFHAKVYLLWKEFSNLKPRDLTLFPRNTSSNIILLRKSRGNEQNTFIHPIKTICCMAKKEQARKLQATLEGCNSKLFPLTGSLTGVKCRATSVAKKNIIKLRKTRGNRPNNPFGKCCGDIWQLTAEHLCNLWLQPAGEKDNPKPSNTKCDKISIILPYEKYLKTL